jgi:hypothetical protein
LYRRAQPTIREELYSICHLEKRCESTIFSMSHLETTPDAARLLIDNCRHELDGSRFVQTEEEILSDREKFDRINGVMQSLIAVLEKQGDGFNRS